MSTKKSPRRQFLEKISGSLAALGLLSLPKSVTAAPSILNSVNEDDWLKNLKGKHKVVFDVPHPNDMFPFAWPKVFVMTNMQSGSELKDINAVVVLRHSGIGYAFNDKMWEKYNFGESLKADDPRTKKAALVNPFYMAKDDDYKVPGVGAVPLSIPALQKDGVQFVVCDMAMTVYSNALAKNMKPEDVKADWLANMVPGVTVVPSGVWALGRAQEKGCGYIFAG